MTGESQQYLVNAPSPDVTNAEVFATLSNSKAQWICKRLIRRIKACGMPNALSMSLSKTLNEGRCKGQDEAVGSEANSAAKTR
jgi:hypothetical protein